MDSNGAGAADSLALLAGSLLKAIAAVCAPQAMGPWIASRAFGGRPANYLDLHAWHFAALALKGSRNEKLSEKSKGFPELDQATAGCVNCKTDGMEHG